MLAKVRRCAQEQQGFTLIELLVVILIIGLLAAIAIPAFLNQRQKAYDSQTKSNVRAAQTAEEAYATDHGGAYTAATTGSGAAAADPLVTIEPALKNDPAVTATLSAGGYTLVATSGGTGTTAVTYTLVQSNGGVSRTCAPSGKGGCSSTGTW
jgi:type IV pilus assembly protein PilA